MLLVLTVLAQLSAAPTHVEVRLPAATPATVLAGTITAPSHAAVAGLVLVSVAGPDERDMQIGSHRLFANFAVQLAERRIVSLRLDDRGVGASTGSWLTATFEDRVDDACRAVELLRAHHPTIPIGLLGMSEGGGIALHAATSCIGAPFLVLLSTPIGDGRAELDAQLTRLLANTPWPDSTRSALRADARKLVALAGDTTDEVRAATELRSLLSSPRGRLLLPPYRFVPRDVDGQVHLLQSPWYRSQLNYRVLDALGRYHGPIMAIYGALDTIIDASATHAQLATARPGDGIHLVPGLNHLLQEAVTGAPSE